METVNRTSFAVEQRLQDSVADCPTAGLLVEIKYCPNGTSRAWPASGTYYRRTARRPQGKLIRLRINRLNRYPVGMMFKTPSYFTRRNAHGEEVVYQEMKRVDLRTPEDLLTAVFLHEFSHYLDHIAGRNGRYKQTKADQFALARLKELGVKV